MIEDKGAKQILANQKKILEMLDEFEKRYRLADTRISSIEHKVDRIWLLVKPAIDKLME